MSGVLVSWDPGPDGGSSPRGKGRPSLPRIWFNRAYSTNIHTIALLRDNPDRAPVRVFGTHTNLSSPVLSACDVAESEPHASVVGDAYVDWALAFCSRHRIDVFIPQLHLETIAAARDKFTSSGVAVVAGPPGPAALLADKAAAYADARLAGLAVPPYRVVGTGDELVAAFDELTVEVGSLCLKPVTGAGGEGFRTLTAARPTFADMSGAPTTAMHFADVAQALDAHLGAGAVVPPLMVLPFLPGPEVSVDCLADSEGHVLAAIPRTKLSRRRLLVDDPAAVDVARTIVGRHKLSSLSNTQVRYWAHPARDTAPLPYLLETNTRISGGLYQTALSGLNLPWAAVLQALGRPFHLESPQLGLSYTTVSSMVLLEHGLAEAG